MDSAAIGELREDEVEAAVALWHATGLTRPWNNPHADAYRALSLPASTILAARHAGKLAGTAMVGHDGHRGWVYYLGVAVEYRRQGIGMSLMQAAEKWCIDRGIPKVQLMIRTDNEAVRHFYEALGYEMADVIVMGRRID